LISIDLSHSIWFGAARPPRETPGARQAGGHCYFYQGDRHFRRAVESPGLPGSFRSVVISQGPWIRTAFLTRTDSREESCGRSARIEPFAEQGIIGGIDCLCRTILIPSCGLAPIASSALEWNQARIGRRLAPWMVPPVFRAIGEPFANAPGPS